MKGTSDDKAIWTIGHSTHPLKEFISMLQSFGIHMLVDIRSYPGSRRYPQFNKEELEFFLPESNIQYFHFKNLGRRRRKANPDSRNTKWKSPAFRGYADYMETDTFKQGIKDLEKIALRDPTAYMCSEAVWWRCHCSLVSDYLKARGWKVMHIMGIGKAEEHPYTGPASIVEAELSYQKEEKWNPSLFSDLEK